jgi:hypothetical protein
MAIRHPAILLALDTDEVMKLRAAAAVVNAPDPLDALQRIDSDPPGVSYLSGTMSNAMSPYGKASYALAAGLELAIRNWEGEAKGAFLAEAGGVQRDHMKAEDLTKKTSYAGQRMDPKLDELSKTAADDTLGIAQGAYEASVMVLSGDLSPEYVEAVEEACAAIVADVDGLVDSINDIAPELSDLDQPVRA